MFVSSLLLASCAATPREPGPPQVISIDRVVSLSEIKGVALNIYLEDWWTLERESDHMLTFISENSDFIARVFLGTQYDTRVFYREHLVIAPTSDGATLRTSQSLISNLGSSFERAAPVEGLGGKRLLKIKSVLTSAPQSAPISSAPSSAAISMEDQVALKSLATGAATLTKLTLTSGYGVAMQEGRAVVNWKKLYNDARWAELALSVMKVNSGSNLAWFYLGRSAEGLGHKEAAATYYRNSIEASKKKLISACINCFGFRFPADSLSRLQALQIQ
jgi:hypothetical protein